MQEHERVRYVTRNFQELQGFKSVLAGVLVLTGAALNASGSLWSLILCAVVLVGMGPLWVVADRYYKHAFGHVWPARAGRPRFWWPIRAAGVLTVVVLAVLEALTQPTISLLAIAMAVGLISIWWTERPFKSYYLVFSALLVVVALLPLVGLLPSERSPHFNAVMAFGITGAVMVLRGVMDHLWLMRNLKALPEEGDGSAV